MNGLSQIIAEKNRNSIYKEAGEGSLENNMKQLITDEAYSQIASKFPSLVPLIVGINIIEMIDENTTIGAAVLGVSGKKLLVPVLYINGDVDATTFIYSEDEDTILALTKKIVKTVTESSSILAGTVPNTKTIQNYDIGDIHRLFVPPKTFSPKIASETGGLLFAVVEQSDLIKTALAEKLSNNDYYNEFSSFYGTEAADYILESSLEKTALEVDMTSPEVKFSNKEIMNSEWLHKEAAMKEFALNGFAISQGEGTVTKSLVKISSVATKLKEITGDDSISTITTGDQGAFTIYRLSDLKPIDIILSKNINADKYSTPEAIFGPYIDDLTAGTIKGDGIVGRQKNLSDISELKPFSSAIRNITLVIINNGEVWGHTNIFINEEKIKEGLGRKVIKLSGSRVGQVVIDKDSNANPIIMGTTLYVGENNVRIIERGDHRSKEAVVTVSDLDKELDGHKLVKVAYDGVEFLYKNSAYSTKEFVHKMISEGYDKESIYSLVKTAAKDGSAEFAAINAKLDMLGNLVMNLAGQVRQTAQTVESVQQGGLGTLPPQIPQEVPTQEETAIDPGSASLTMQDPNSGIPTPEQEAEMAAQQQNTVAQDQQMLSQQPQQMPMSDSPQNMPQVSQHQDGMNTSVDPEVLRTLAELKDSNIMDVGIISMIAASSELGEVISQYSSTIYSGASAIGRILLNAMVKRNSIIEQVGEPKYKQMINNLKTVFIKISDLYVDITRLQLESDGQMAY